MTRRYKQTTEKMASAVETGNRPQYETSKRAGSGEEHTNMETFHRRQTDKNNCVKKSIH
jgi:hypothetical protein